MATMIIELTEDTMCAHDQHENGEYDIPEGKAKIINS